MEQRLSPHQLERFWAEHLRGEFESKDVEATLATMVEEAHVNHMPPTAKKIAVDVVVVVQFRGDKLACERIYRDHAAVLRQAGLLTAGE